jgi:type I restriction enzyme S subunit
VKIKDMQKTLPKGWEWVRLEEIAEITGGYAFKSEELSKEKLSDEYLPVVKIGNLNKFGNINLVAIEFHKYNNELCKFLIRKNDILVAMGTGLYRACRKNICLCKTITNYIG